MGGHRQGGRRELRLGGRHRGAARREVGGRLHHKGVGRKQRGPVALLTQASRVAGGNRQDARAAQGEGHRALAPAQGGAGGVHLPRLQHEVNEGGWAPTLYIRNDETFARRERAQPALVLAEILSVVQVLTPAHAPRAVPLLLLKERKK